MNETVAILLIWSLIMLILILSNMFTWNMAKEKFSKKEEPKEEVKEFDEKKIATMFAAHQLLTKLKNLKEELESEDDVEQEEQKGEENDK